MSVFCTVLMWIGAWAVLSYAGTAVWFALYLARARRDVRRAEVAPLHRIPAAADNQPPTDRYDMTALEDTLKETW